MFTIPDPMIHDPMIHDSCINYANMLTLYRDNSQNHRKGKYKDDMQRPGFLREENKPDQRSFIFLKIIIFSFNIL